VEPSSLYFTVTEASRLTGVAKATLYRKHKHLFIEAVRHGRRNRFKETLVSFGNMQTICFVDLGAVFDYYRLKKSSRFGFRINEASRLIGKSRQWIDSKIKDGTLRLRKGRRNYRTKDEPIIMAQDLLLIGDFKTMDVLKMFKLDEIPMIPNVDYNKCVDF